LFFLFKISGFAPGLAYNHRRKEKKRKEKKRKEKKRKEKKRKEKK